jgi:hypothetical protein
MCVTARGRDPTDVCDEGDGIQRMCVTAVCVAGRFRTDIQRTFDVWYGIQRTFNVGSTSGAGVQRSEQATGNASINSTGY